VVSLSFALLLLLSFDSAVNHFLLPAEWLFVSRGSGLLPDPAVVEVIFSAAIEFLVSSSIKIRQGPNPLKNDRGLYVDSQLFYYLADPDAVVVSNEDFFDDIKLSPQKSRIISYEQFRQL
jgi:hypothetical protein